VSCPAFTRQRPAAYANVEPESDELQLRAGP
jgi:hypothetical protein